MLVFSFPGTMASARETREDSDGIISLVRETADGLGKLIADHVKLARVELVSDARFYARDLAVMAVAGLVLFVQRAGVLGGEERALVERVDVRAVGADEEMTRHADPKELEPDTSAHFDHQHAQGDRQPESSVQHDVEVRVARVAVVDGVAREAARHEELARECWRVDIADVERECIERSQLRVDINGMVVRGDQERGFVERDVVVGLLHNRREALRDVHLADRTRSPGDRATDSYTCAP